jgi:hypothetical protein
MAAPGHRFFAWSVYTMLVEPMNGCWTELTRNVWGNQIWFDLIFGVAIGWTLILSRARAVDMNIVLWFLFVVATANIGLSPMLARMLFLEEEKKFQYARLSTRFKMAASHTPGRSNHKQVRLVDSLFVSGATLSGRLQ